MNFSWKKMESEISHLAIISCFWYPASSKSSNFRALREENIANDLIEYLNFCQLLGVPPERIVLLTDLPTKLLSKVPYLSRGEVCYISSSNDYTSIISERIRRYQPTKFFFFFNGHGDTNKHESWLIIPTGRERSAYLPAYQLMLAFKDLGKVILQNNDNKCNGKVILQNNDTDQSDDNKCNNDRGYNDKSCNSRRKSTKEVDCFWFFDCCHSEGMVILPYKWTCKGKTVIQTVRIFPNHVRIYSFHSSKRKEESSFLPKKVKSSLFTNLCLSQLSQFIQEHGDRHFSLPSFLQQLKKVMHSWVIEKQQQKHQPIFMTNQSGHGDTFSFGRFINKYNNPPLSPSPSLSPPPLPSKPVVLIEI